MSTTDTDAHLYEEIDVQDENLDTIGEMVYDELTICDVCGADVEGVDGIEQGTTDGSVTISVTFDCSKCGGFNENTAFLS